MDKLTFDEAMLLAKAVAYALGDRNVSFNNADKELAVSRLKKIADQRLDWTLQQKEQYKALLDICSELSS